MQALQEPTLLDCAHSIIEIVPRLSRLMRKDLRDRKSVV